MARHNILGKEGEDFALEFLKKAGFKILARNWRVQHLEIDIIAQKQKTIHFVEVKTRTEEGRARESLSIQKQKRLEKLARLWFKEQKIRMSGQFDFIALTTTQEGGFSLEYYPNYTQN